METPRIGQRVRTSDRPYYRTDGRISYLRGNEYGNAPAVVFAGPDSDGDYLLRFRDDGTRWVAPACFSEDVPVPTLEDLQAAADYLGHPDVFRAIQEAAAFRARLRDA